MKLKCVEIKLPLYNFLSPKSYQSVVVDVADMFLGIAVHHSFQSPPERLVTKNTRRTTVCQKHVLAFIQRDKAYADPGYLLVVLCLFKVISSTRGTSSCSYHWWCHSRLTTNIGCISEALSARLVPQCTHEIWYAYGKHMHPQSTF
jgi:hypothetical protein